MCLCVYVFAMVGQTAQLNGLNFSEETHGYPWGWYRLNIL